MVCDQHSCRRLRSLRARVQHSRQHGSRPHQEIRGGAESALGRREQSGRSAGESVHDGRAGSSAASACDHDREAAIICSEQISKNRTTCSSRQGLTARRSAIWKRTCVAVAPWLAFRLRCWLMGLCSMLRVHVFVEQPRGSTFYKFDCVQTALSMCGARKLITYMGGFGLRSMKPTTLYVRFPEGEALSKLVCSYAWTRTRIMALGMKPLTHQTPKGGSRSKGKGSWKHRGWVTGVKGSGGQKESSAYTLEFARHLAAVIIENCPPSA